MDSGVPRPASARQEQNPKKSVFVVLRRSTGARPPARECGDLRRGGAYVIFYIRNYKYLRRHCEGGRRADAAIQGGSFWIASRFAALAVRNDKGCRRAFFDTPAAMVYHALK
jgi:hypothetical protein